MDMLDLLDRLDAKRMWDEEPVFCFTSDVDWASEAVLQEFLADFRMCKLPLTVFVTHESKIVNKYKEEGLIERGIHPNFLADSSHGEGLRTVIETCIKFAPEATGYRSHRLFDVSDVSHLLHDEYGFKYVSNLGTIMQTRIRPILHESGLVHFPIFFEDGVHLRNRMGFDLSAYLSRFESPGIKIISVHPMNYVVNTPEIDYMRKIKDTLSRQEYNTISAEEIGQRHYAGLGTKNLVEEIVSLAGRHSIVKLSELYEMAVS